MVYRLEMSPRAGVGEGTGKMIEQASQYFAMKIESAQKSDVLTFKASRVTDIETLECATAGEQGDVDFIQCHFSLRHLWPDGFDATLDAFIEGCGAKRYKQGNCCDQKQGNEDKDLFNHGYDRFDDI